MPTVSVIIPNYNHALYLKERIDSVVNQSYQNIEVIILDDCSTDNSRDIIEKYRNHPKVKKIIYNKINSGSTFKQWNKGIENAEGELIWIAESDDKCDENFLSTLVPKISNNSNCVIAYSQSYRLNSENDITGSWKNFTDNLDTHKFSEEFYMKGIDFINDFLIYKNVIPNASAVIFKKKAFLHAGKADETIKYCGDWYLWLKILTEGYVYFNPQNLNYFRYHDKSVISTSRNKEFFRKKYDIILREEFNRILSIKKISHIKKINKSLLTEEILIETKFHYRLKDYILFTKYFFKYLFNYITK